MPTNTVNATGKNQKTLIVSWILIAVLAILLITLVSLGVTKNGGVGILIVCIFAMVHGINRYGIKNMLFFFVIASVISWCYESLSIKTGFPFGHYYYSDVLGTKIGLVPVIIMFSYFGVAYLAWTVGQVLIDQQNSRLKGASLFTIPVIASFVMVLWDLCFDPYAATLNQAWIWENGGGYFGVPIVNFLGWYLCTFTIFFVFSLFLKYTYYKKQTNLVNPTTQQMLTPCVMYGALSLQHLLNIFITDDSTVISLDNQIWQAASINEAMTTVCLFTMGFVVVLSVIKLLTKKPETSGEA